MTFIMDKPKKSKKKIIAVIAIIAVLAAGGIGLTSCVAGAAVPDGTISQSFTDSAVIEKQNLMSSISVSGTVEGGNIVKITSTFSAKVQTLNVDIGDYVKEGDVLCVFDSSDIQDEYDNLKKSIDKANAANQNTHEINQRNLADAEAERNSALAQAQRAIDEAILSRDKAYDKYNKLVEKCDSLTNKTNESYNALSSADELNYEMLYQQYQDALLSQKNAEAELESLESQLSTFDSAVQTAQDAYDTTDRSTKSAVQSVNDAINAEKFSEDTTSQAQLEKLAEKLEQCTVKAPKSGLITSLNVAEGSIPTTDSIMTIEDSNSLKINVQIKETDILNVKEGMKAVIKTTATGEEEISGTVSRVVNILSGADPMLNKEGGYTAEITIDEKDTDLLIGMNAKAKIILEEKKNVLAVPYDAIDEDNSGNNIVYIAQKQDDGSYNAHAVQIEKGLETDYYTEIISSEISEGDIILLSPNKMREGKKVNISEDIFSAEETSENAGE